MIRGNPEMMRNLRGQLRSDRMIAVAVICLVLSTVVALAQSPGVGLLWRTWGEGFLRLVVSAQAAVLILGGALAALHAIQRERELNTFDYQRLTRLPPADLTVGKLLGAPALMYFVALCLVPAAIAGAVAAHARPPFVLAAYGLLVLGALAVHAFALLLSLLVERGIGLLTGLALLVALWTSSVFSMGAAGALALGTFSPFVAVDVALLHAWPLDTSRQVVDFPITLASRFTDVAFGHPVSHLAVLVVLYIGFAAWFLLAVVRNIKRDPALYQLYTPPQALGFALWINLIVLAFFRWSHFTPLNAVTALLTPNAVLFFVLGVALLKNRDAARRLRAHGASGWGAAVWPAPCIGPGLLAAGLVPVAIVVAGGAEGTDWNLGLALFRVVYIAVWVARDLLFLQWMVLQRGGRPLRRGLQYLAVYYVCAAVLLLTFRVWTFDNPTGLAASAVFVPPMALSLSPEAWGTDWMLWAAGLAVELTVAGLLAGLQHAKLDELDPEVNAPAATQPQSV